MVEQVRCIVGRQPLFSLFIVWAPLVLITGDAVAREFLEREVFMGSRVWGTRIALIAAILVVVGVAYADTIVVEEWLVAGPVTIPHAEADTGLNIDPVAQLLDNIPVDPFEFWPVSGDPVMLGIGNRSEFRVADGALPVDGANGTRFALLASYLSSPAWQEGTLSIITQSPFALFVDGESTTSNTDYQDEPDTTTHDVVLDQGHHRILLAVALSDTQDVEAWTVNVSYEQNEDTPAEWLPSATLNPEHKYDIIDYFRTDNVSTLEISSDGRWLAADISRRSRKDDAITDRLEVWDTKKNELIWTYRAAKGVGNVAWSPDNERLLFRSDGTLFLWHREANMVERIEVEFEDASSFRWSADGHGLFYLKSIENELSDEDYQVVWKLADRWRNWRNHTALQYFSITDALDTRVLTLKYGIDRWDVGRDGKTIAFKRTLPQQQRPYEHLELLIYNLETGEFRSVYEGKMQSWSTAITLSPDCKQLAFTGPTQETPGDDAPPPYINTGHQALWILDIESGDVRRVDPDFEPSIHYILYRTSRGNEIAWHEDGHIAFDAIYNKKVLYCTWSPGDDHIQSRQLSTPGYSNLTIATGKGASMVAYKGDVVNDAPDVHAYDTKRGRGGVLIDLNDEMTRLTESAETVVDYEYVNSDGVTIYGYLYYPAGYDESGNFPLVVDTYGGVIGFGDSWMPLSQIMANRGYFVYVPIPRGAVGYGQEYADTHANDWGELSSRDMNEGLRHIVANVPGVDGDHVGFASGSYGGYLAMYLLSIPKYNPDYYPYATAISDYGISNLASYWGIGWWGVHYSEKASTGSYPWNAADWYNKHSPLYQADNITAPLLLLHGASDVNVPVGESAQMFAALQVLHRDVVYIKFPGEDHGIASTRTKYLKSKRMHIEWFDKYLRDRPGAWDKRMEDEFQK